MMLKSIRWSSPPMYTRYLREFTNALLVFQVRIGYLMDEEWGDGGGSEPPKFSFTGRKSTVAEIQTSCLYSMSVCISLVKLANLRAAAKLSTAWLFHFFSCLDRQIPD
ncbi:hypothetical protein EVAR_23973_1 [Eumeta japonica]|uniref:Uncharacterized protein n=1 Tax=Eumeta variegata TaxID=151549 RepID=A0A4C1V1B6_EUMVA|nr:hypothetical protein EVAR_23973_1 [Eumeta japonica]